MAKTDAEECDGGCLPRLLFGELEAVVVPVGALLGRGLCKREGDPPPAPEFILFERFGSVPVATLEDR